MVFQWKRNGRPNKPVEVCEVGKSWELELHKDHLHGYYVNIRYDGIKVWSGKDYKINSSDANGISQAKHDGEARFQEMIKDGQCTG